VPQRAAPPAPVHAVGRRAFRDRARGALAGLFVFAWPLLAVADRLLPRHGVYTGTTNDFEYLYYVYKAYLLDCLCHLHLPLWSPAEGAGFPFYSNPFTQFLYPLNLPLAVFACLAGGYTPLDHQFFTAIGAGLLALGLYLWLRSLGHARDSALLAACVVATSFRVFELFRFPNAVHTAAWLPWILLAVTRILGARSGAEALRWCGALSGFGVLLITAGYLYFVYYAPFLLGPYLAIAAVPSLRQALLPKLTVTWRRLAVVCFGAGLAGAACTPYLLKVQQLLSATRDRTGGSLAYSTEHAFGWKDTVGSLVFPPAASPDGCFYIGLAGTLLIVLYLWAALARRGEGSRDDRLAAGALVLWFVAVSYVSYGTDSLAFRLLWHLAPGFSRLRVWARLSIVLLPILAWLLARAFDRLASRDGSRSRGGVHREQLWIPLLLAYGIALALQLRFLPPSAYHWYWHVHLIELRPLASWFVASGAIALVALAAGVWLGSRGEERTARRTLLAAVLAATALDVWPVGSRLWTTEVHVPRRAPLDVLETVRRSLTTPRHAEYNTIVIRFDHATRRFSLSPAFGVSVIQNWYFESYVRFLIRAKDEPAARNRLLGLQDGRRLFLSQRVDHESLAGFLADADTFGGAASVVDYDGGRLVADVEAPNDGFLTFVDNWDPDWRAAVNDKRVPLVRTFGTFKAVAVPAGSNRVTMTYEPGFSASDSAR
jgi:hypothetical protein